MRAREVKKKTGRVVTEDDDKYMIAAKRIANAYRALRLDVGMLFVPESGKRYEFKVVERGDVEKMTSGCAWRFVGTLGGDTALLKIIGSGHSVHSCYFSMPSFADCVLAREVGT